MKQKDIGLILVAVFIGAVLSLILSKVIFGSSTDMQQKVEVVQPITANFQQPDSKYFNTSSIDPTQLITIGNSNNQQPFNNNQ